MNRRIVAIIAVLAVCVIAVSVILLTRGSEDQVVRTHVDDSAVLPAAPEAKGGLLEEALQLEESGNLLGAKEVYAKAINSNPQGEAVGEMQQKIWDLNLRMLLSGMQTPNSASYEVQPGDTLGKIAKSYGTTVDLIKKSNGLQSDLIKPAMKLKISTALYRIHVDKSQNTLILKSDDSILKIYRVSTGLNNSTPVGGFKIVNKLIDPVWYSTEAIVPPGSPKNILGTRWLGISLHGYGIHGTTDPDTIGEQITAGCVRMYNREVEELYSIVPVGTEVTITD